MKHIFQNKRGQFRIIEALLAALVLFTIFTASIFLTTTSRIHVLQERSDLDRTGHNILLRLVESGVVESTLETVPTFEPVLKTALTRTLPPLTYYSLKVYRADTNVIPSFIQVGTDVTNSPPDALQKASEVSSSSFMYTSSASGQIYYFVLTLAKAG